MCVKTDKKGIAILNTGTTERFAAQTTIVAQTVYPCILGKKLFDNVFQRGIVNKSISGSD